jgi:ABC-2 type transport system permease protein
VPTSVFPEAVERVAAFLPLHHGLLGFRELLAHGPSLEVARRFTAEMAIGAAWFLAALVAFRVFAESGRRDGTIDLAE